MVGDAGNTEYPNTFLGYSSVLLPEETHNTGFYLSLPVSTKLVNFNFGVKYKYVFQNVSIGFKNYFKKLLLYRYPMRDNG